MKIYISEHYVGASIMTIIKRVAVEARPGRLQCKIPPGEKPSIIVSEAVETGPRAALVSVDVASIFPFSNPESSAVDMDVEVCTVGEAEVLFASFEGDGRPAVMGPVAVLVGESVRVLSTL